MPHPAAVHPWRVAITRDVTDDALAAALMAEGLRPRPLPVLVEGPPGDPAALDAAARTLDRIDWAVLASVRAVRALSRARGALWPPALRTAAVGPVTARALRDAGVRVPPVVGASDGSEALWAVLREAAPWPGLRVLVATTAGGRTDLAARLSAAGADVHVVEAYRMHARPAAAIAADWTAAAPQAVLVTSSRAADGLIAAVGAAALRATTVVALGETTAATLASHGVACARPTRAGAADIARLIRDQLAVERPS